jgi:hypothetical protein
VESSFQAFVPKSAIHVVVVISQHLLNVFVQLANKRGLKKKVSSEKISCSAHFIFTTDNLAILDDEYKLRSISLCNVLNYSVAYLKC